MTHQINQALNRGFRLLNWPGWCGLFALLFAGAALAADPLYENDAALYYTIPSDPFTPIDATNFLNNNWFQVTFTSYAGGLNGNVETIGGGNGISDTVNYTNIGTMVTTSSILTNSSGVILSLNPGCGFNFDTFSTSSQLEQMAGSFFNPGNIRANSQVDLAQQAFEVSTVGKCIVWATNIICPGTIDLGLESLIQLTGQNLDLTRGNLVIENGTGLGSVLVPAPTANNAGFGVDTNRDWDPGIDLTATTALPSLVRIGATVPAIWTYPPGYPSYPVPTTPYVTVSQVATNDFIYRYVFVDNTVPNVTANVYVSSFNVFASLGFGVVEFVGSYVNPVTGLPANNYLYLIDDYALGAANPGLGANGVPLNFSFIPSTTSLLPGTLPDTPAFLALPSGAISNAYSFANVQAIPTSVATNSLTKNNTNYLAVMPGGRTLISANSSLDLTLARVTGQNYLQLRSPVQFNGSVGATISSPYSDINLGVTNGFLTVTNLMEPTLPAWSGSLQAWSTRFLSFTTNSIIVFSNTFPIATNSFLVTNDYRVLIVANEATATTPAEVQDLKFHAATNLVISDVFNVLRSVSIDAQNLTLTTNAPGSVSPDGELDLQSLPVSGQYAFLWQNSFPNLYNLTNGGAIRIPSVNPVNIGSSAAPYGAFINHGIFTDQGVIIYAANFESDGTFSNGVLGSFILQSQAATLTNGQLTAGGDVSITAGSLVASNVVLSAGRSLKLVATNLLTDDGVTNGNFWTVGAATVSTADSGLVLPLKPAKGDLLGTTITLFAPAGKIVMNTWAALDLGVSTAGYTNNAAIGHLILDALGPALGTQFTNTGVGAANAIYVDRLELRDFAGYQYHDSGGNLPALGFNTNLVIYYADAVDPIYGDVSVELNHKNNNHLRWVPSYAGYFSSTNLVYLGVTNAYNVALAENTVIDSDGDGTANASDPTPFFLSSMVDPVVIYQTNPPSGPLVISWNSIPHATNFVFYSTNAAMGSFTNLLTNFSTNLSGPFTLSNFISPIPYPSSPARVKIFTPVPASMLFYQPAPSPWLTYPY